MIKKIMVLCLIVIVSLCGSVTAFADESEATTEDKTEIVTEEVSEEVTEVVTENITEAETENPTEITKEVSTKEDYQYTIFLVLLVIVGYMLFLNILK